MTEQQIKQNAFEYSLQNCIVYDDNGANDMDSIREAFIDGAHSRDEEVVKLKKDVHDLEQALACAEDVADIQHEKLDQLRNPWISVEEQLPEKVKGKYYSKYVLVRYNGFGCRYCVDRYCYLSKTWAFQVDGVTHWMYIPELKDK